MDACPHCGGKSGYTGVLSMTYQMMGEWGGVWEVSGTENCTYRSPTVKCDDCGKRVNNRDAQYSDEMPF